MGVTSVGIHERAGREKIFSANVARMIIHWYNTICIHMIMIWVWWYDRCTEWWRNAQVYSIIETINDLLSASSMIIALLPSSSSVLLRMLWLWLVLLWWNGNGMVIGSQCDIKASRTWHRLAISEASWSTVSLPAQVRLWRVIIPTQFLRTHALLQLPLQSHRTNAAGRRSWNEGRLSLCNLFRRSWCVSMSPLIFERGCKHNVFNKGDN